MLRAAICHRRKFFRGAVMRRACSGVRRFLMTTVLMSKFRRTVRVSGNVRLSGSQQAIHFTEYWIPVREIGGITRANRDAVLNLTRRPSSKPDAVSLNVALNVTSVYRKAQLQLRDGPQVVATEEVSLTRRMTYQKQFLGSAAGKTSP